MGMVVDREAWLQARLALLQQEKALTRQRDVVTAARQALPWLRVETDYRFTGEAGECGLETLFAGRSQLIVYHFMLVPGGKPCRICSFWAEQFDAVRTQIGRRDVEVVAVSRAPFAEIQAVQARMGWRFPWFSSFGGSFNVDFGVTVTPEQAGGAAYNFGTQPVPPGEWPGLSVFARRDGAVFHTYGTYARGLDALNATYQLLDLVPAGRDEAALPFSMGWVRYKDEA